MASPVEEIKSRLGIADVVGSYIKLEKAGANYRARCPFHNEKTPSFFVSPSRDTYHCFGCSKGGDIISFVQEIEGLDFLGALETLAARAGVELTPHERTVRTENERYLAVMAEATRFYREALKKSPEALAYLHHRGVTDETIERFQLGFAPDGWRNCYDHLLNQGFAETDTETVGLILRANATSGSRGDRYYDRFRSRIMFPIADSVGRTIAFSGRIFGNHDDKIAKYINSPQTPLFDKSLALYGFDKAKLAIKREDKAILVEGQMDLIMSHQAGIENTVAVSGTALTTKHLNFIKRLSNNLVMAFDADMAGIAASRRAVDLALPLGLEVNIAMLPEGEDPAEIIAKDSSLWHAAIQNAKHFVDFYLAVLMRRRLDSRALKLAVSKEVLPYVAKLPSAIDQAHFVARIADLLNIKEEPVWIELRRSRGAASTGPSELGPAVSETARGRRDMIEARIFSIWYWKESPEIGDRLKSDLGERFAERNAHYEERKDRLILEAEIAYDGANNLEHEVDDLFYHLKEEVLKEALTAATQELKQAEHAGDYEAVESALKQCQSISQAINDHKSKFIK